MGDMKKPSARELGRYVVENIDKAIAENWITVYYQPVVRTITGELCGMEALARWMDPNYGMLPPDSFIGVLEKARLIHKLDSYIIKRACQDYARSMAEDERTVTVSFNLSRLDFKLMDVHSVIEDEIRANRVPRDAFRVEITESVMESDDRTMHEAIDRFWDKGLRVWMDDFGSGYSSLNVLKDYHFDTLKIDMIFLRNFDSRSREIVKSVVDMSKRLGVHTLAEGVETEEQLEFLKSIGCEKAQGYYIGKPMSYDDVRAYIKEKGYVIESPVKRQYYHDIGKVNVLSATPLATADYEGRWTDDSEGQIALAVIEYEDGRLKYLFNNQSYMDTLTAMGVASIEEVEEEFADDNSALHSKFLSMIEQARETSEIVTVDMFKNGVYCIAQMRSIAGYSGGDAFLCMLHNLSKDAAVEKSSMITQHLQSVCTMYEMILVVNLNTDRSEMIYSSTQTRHIYGRGSAVKEIADYAIQEIYPEDREKYLEFSDLTTMERRIAESNVHHVSAPFRTRTQRGTYEWSLYTYLFDGDPADRKVLSCLRRLSSETIARLHGSMELAAEETEKAGASQGMAVEATDLWRNFWYNSDTGFFWKDKNRRFIGANKKFLDYFDFDSADIIVGKTDEDMGWHVDSVPYRIDEERVLGVGDQTYLVPGSVVRKGEIRSILASKFPIFKNGEIVGLMGYFLDMEEMELKTTELKDLSLYDHASGTLNFLGLMESMLKFQDAYALDNKDFALIILDISHFHIFRKDYGYEFCEHLLKEVAMRIRKISGDRYISGRVGGDHFVVIGQFEDDDSINKLIDRIKNEAETITEVDKISVTVYLYSGYSRYSETRDMQEMYMAANKAMKEADR